jgi:hypothetical protein
MWSLERDSLIFRSSAHDSWHCKPEIQGTLEIIELNSFTSITTDLVTLNTMPVASVSGKTMQSCLHSETSV